MNFHCENKVRFARAEQLLLSV